MKQKCANCSHLVSTEVLGEEDGEIKVVGVNTHCHSFPPVVVTRYRREHIRGQGYATYASGNEAQWPAVSPDDRCGEFTPTPVE